MTHSQYVSVALVIQHTERMRYISLSLVAWLVLLVAWLVLLVAWLVLLVAWLVLLVA
jgi:hypothetical protein